MFLVKRNRFLLAVLAIFAVSALAFGACAGDEMTAPAPNPPEQPAPNPPDSGEETTTPAPNPPERPAPSTEPPDNGEEPNREPIVLAPLPVGDDVDVAILGNNQFAIDFYQQIVANNPTNNQFFSPWSMMAAFALAAEGARGETADEIWRAFGLGDLNEQQRREALRDIIAYINNPSDEFELETANSFWLRVQPPQAYLDTVTDYYSAEIRELTGAREPLDEWVAEKTRDKIEEAPLSDEVIMRAAFVIMNALYFKGNWETQFDPEYTEAEGEFWTGEATVNTPLMNLSRANEENVNFNYFANENLQAIELPYEGDRLSMLVLLPRDENGLGALEQSLTSAQLASIRESMAETILDAVTLPKFELNFKYNLKPILQSLGVELAFSGGADFAGLGYRVGDLTIGEAAQATFVRVDEEGTEAAAVTALGVLSESVPPPNPTFIADHPFIFAIQDDETGNILFMGKITDPSATE